MMIRFNLESLKRNLTAYQVGRFFLIALIFISCNQKTYDDKVEVILDSLQSPVVIIGKYKAMGHYGVTLRDAKGKIRTIGNVSIFANAMGESRNLGDTIK